MTCSSPCIRNRRARGMPSYLKLCTQLTAIWEAGWELGEGGGTHWSRRTYHHLRHQYQSNPGRPHNSRNSGHQVTARPLLAPWHGRLVVFWIAPVPLGRIGHVVRRLVSLLVAPGLAVAGCGRVGRWPAINMVTATIALPVRIHWWGVALLVA